MKLFDSIHRAYRKARGEDTTLPPAATNPIKALLDALRTAFPAGVAEFLDVEIPEMRPIETPVTDVASAIVAEGILAENINEILCLYQGLRLLRVPLHVGQDNSVLQAQLLASIETSRTPAPLILDPETQKPDTAAAAAQRLNTQLQTLQPGPVPDELQGILTDARNLQELIDQESLKPPDWTPIGTLIAMLSGAWGAKTIGTAALRSLKSVAKDIVEDLLT